MTEPVANLQADLIAAAVAVQSKAYAKYSQFLVGAAVRAVGGQVYVGCNVENASYGLTVCAERVAIFSAVAAGARQLEEIAVVTAGGFPPCGACLQVMSEFAPRMSVLIVDADKPESVVRTAVNQLLPTQFEWPGKD
jgi:cytidine deaminase